MLSEFTETEWQAFYPYDDYLCEAEIKVQPTEPYTEFNFTVTPNAEARELLVSSVSSDAWPAGQYRLDIRFTKNGEYIFVPADTFVAFQIIEPASDDNPSL